MQQAIRGQLQQKTYIPKGELLTWLNGLLSLDYSKVEQCAKYVESWGRSKFDQCFSGAAYCQVLDALYPEEFPLQRISYHAKAEHESIKNYKIMQQFFMVKGISKPMDVERMMKGRPIDNLEFLQWLKGFYDEHSRGCEYDAVARRKNAGLKVATSGPSLVSRTPKKSSTPSKPHYGTSHVGAASRASSVESPFLSPGPRNSCTPATITPGTRTPEPALSHHQVQQYRNEIEVLQHTVQELEKERDFYYGKLRSVELLCQSTEENPDGHGKASVQAGDEAIVLERKVLANASCFCASDEYG
ncbi:hypothetical protein GUITHDRAFT_115262 [Guillardia theta CCMP2712]|uniref:Calponin-homology (CH) domain-containing protein n=1 Tax=Guillardia theta (strain CCMP2712) TaxID=905079 RepID=L1ISA9_GUITC|nr:hypothetical protein GUITHDRAFT_115262 [Guillardia theta CCMP2712]EKX38715.1 hypothetical protein GUITHDRAFT_115262 [Guillardia theta CCMP2712]|eukprot:XP_005825695.1 hypothetical protein GUITHDRAFT_115262 [Guillardia theta CCMP2712]